jgi:hypothetical protein
MIVIVILVAVPASVALLSLMAWAACRAADAEFIDQYDNFWKPILNMPDNVTAQSIIDKADAPEAQHE